MNKERFIEKEGHRLHYRTFGDGNQPFLFFHGFGQGRDIFGPPEAWLQKYKFYSFDLFYHGESTGDRRALTLDRWQTIFKEFLHAESLTEGNLIISGYSLGGRFVLATAALFPTLIDRTILIAPDGVYRSNWYLAANTFRPIFRYFMSHPSHFNRLLTLGEKWKFANATLIKFSRQELGPVENRMRVYYCWTLLKPLGFSHKQLVKRLNNAGTRGFLFLGEKDYIIPIEKVLPTLEKVTEIEGVLLPLRHHEMIEGAWVHLLQSGEL